MSTLSLHLLTILVTISVSRLPHSTTALPRHRPPSLPPAAANGDSQTAYFEVTKPIPRPKTKPCSYLLLRHDFGYTYGGPPVSAAYSPPNPADCPTEKFSTVVLEWRASSIGRQFDRIFGVWLGGVELLRGCTAEPRPNGVVWKVEKDVTRYYSLLMTNQTLAVYLGNLITTTYTGIYHVEISIHFYPSNKKPNPTSNYDKWADLILPISRVPPLNDGLWFEIENSTDIKSKEFQIPPNAYKAVLEVYLSFHENDEFWYSNLPNDYIAANNLSGAQGNGPFREVLVSLDDGIVVGAVWPFTVIYTGGINPLLWRPISGIGSFDLPTYDIELTPLLGKLLDGKKHSIKFGVTNALNVWYIDANLHLWIDKKSPRTLGMLLNRRSPKLQSSTKSIFVGLNGTFETKMSRSISSTGWVKSSHGLIITTFNQDFGFANSMILENDGNVQTVNQTIEFNSSVSTMIPSSRADNTIISHKTFPLYLYTAQIDQGDNTYAILANVTLGFNNEKTESLLKNSQDATGVLVIKNGLLVSGSGKTRQMYKYDSCTDPCYFRNVSSSNYAITYDLESTKCSHKPVSQDPSSVFSLM
ncbi:hypothetical protein V2J09_008858 [Rumex salicifolius]